jgi:hypothetical protein
MPRGRPKKLSRRENNVISIKLSDKELEALNKEVQKKGLDRSSYIRNCLLPVITVSDIPPQDANFIFCHVSGTPEIRICYLLDESRLFVTHLYKDGCMVSIFGLFLENGGNLLYEKKPVKWEIVDEHGTRQLLDVDDIKGDVGDSVIRITGSNNYMRCEVSVFADGRPDEIRMF